MNPEPNPAEVRDWAQTVLRQLGDPLGCTLSVRPQQSGTSEVPSRARPFAPLPHPPESGSGSGSESGAGDDAGGEAAAGVLVTVTFADGAYVRVRLGGSLPAQEAVLKLAEKLQTAVLEQCGGAAVPPCPAAPGHRHPALPRLVSGTASWTCPSAGPDARTRPVV